MIRTITKICYNCKGKGKAVIKGVKIKCDRCKGKGIIEELIIE